MDALLAAHPDFALADTALLWLANLDAREGKSAAAAERYLTIERRFPDREAWALARKGRADLALATSHPFTARALYQSILDSPASAHRPVADAARAGLRLARTALLRLLAFTLALACLTLFFAWSLFWSRPLYLRPLPTELHYYLPVAALFSLCAATENRAIALATATVAVGGAAILFVTTRAAARAATSTPRRLLFAFAVAAAALSLTYAALYTQNLLDFVLETLRAGPER